LHYPGLPDVPVTPSAHVGGTVPPTGQTGGAGAAAADGDANVLVKRKKEDIERGKRKRDKEQREEGEREEGREGIYHENDGTEAYYTVTVPLINGMAVLVATQP
jgi:hypothetical protein